jgi:hypothetical protein
MSMVPMIVGDIPQYFLSIALMFVLKVSYTGMDVRRAVFDAHFENIANAQKSKPSSVHQPSR